MTATTIQPYPSLSVMCRTKRIQILPKPRDTWRLVAQPVVGAINAIPQFRGLAIATNGVIVLLETSAGRDTFIFGHLQFFVKDDIEQETDLDLDIALAKGETPPAAKRKVECLKEFSELFE